MVGAGYVFKDLSWRQGFFVGFLLCSPPVVLAFERGNSDLIIFLILTLMLLLMRMGFALGTWALVLLATALKLFPAFSIAIFLGMGWRQSRFWMPASVAGALVVVAYQWDILRAVIDATPSGTWISYGSTVWVRVSNHLFEINTGHQGAFSSFLIPSILCAVLLCAVSFWSGLRDAQPRNDSRQNIGLDSFRLGSAIYMGTFLLGGHFSYRYIFLLFCLPWLISRIENERHSLTWMRRMGVLLVASCLWLSPEWWRPLFYPSQLAGLMLLATLAWLFGATTPALRFPVNRLVPCAS
jgi:hypothetical protein